jgi:hypothetical protein
MLGLTTLGLVHTAVSLAAVFCGFWALGRDEEISTGNSLGRTCLWATPQRDGSP